MTEESTPDYQRIDKRLQALEGWTRRHEDEHTADTRLLSSILDSMAVHQGNHHSTTSTLKNGGAVGVALSFLYLAVELIRYFAF